MPSSSLGTLFGTCQRLGLASTLVKWDLERADQNGKAIILDASPS
jgi:hypothetical protein